MVALSITPSQVRPDDTMPRRRGRAGEALIAGQVIYYNDEQDLWYKAGARITAQASGYGTDLGLALNNAPGVRQRVNLQEMGEPLLGGSAGVVPGTIYVLGETPGLLYPLTDTKITDFRTVVGVGNANGVLLLSPSASGIQPLTVLNESLVKWVLAGQVSDTTPQVGAILDRQGYEEVTFVLLLGTLVDVDATFTVLLEGSDAANMAGAVAIADGDMISQAPPTAPETAAGFQFNDDGEVRKLGYAPLTTAYRYLRLTITPVNNTGAADVAAYCVLGAGPYTPIMQTSA